MHFESGMNRQGLVQWDADLITALVTDSLKRYDSYERVFHELNIALWTRLFSSENDYVTFIFVCNVLGNADKICMRNSIPWSFESMHGGCNLSTSFAMNLNESMTRESHPFLFKEIAFATRYS